MFDFLKQGNPTDVKGLRSSILQFIKEQLQKAEGGEGKNIRGLSIYVNCAEKEKYLYESALYRDEENKFKEEEVQRIADDYAISLPEDWTLELYFEETLPTEALKIPGVDAALFVSTKKKRAVYKDVSAYIHILNGEAEKLVYVLKPGTKKLNIGREKKVQTADGYYRQNDIAFLGTSANESNRSVSRQHAHIEYNAETGAYYLFADEGGVPPQNKVKVRTIDGTQTKLQTMEIGHKFQEGDQAIIGESAVIEFTYNEPDPQSNE